MLDGYYKSIHYLNDVFINKCNDIVICEHLSSNDSKITIKLFIHRKKLINRIDRQK